MKHRLKQIKNKPGKFVIQQKTWFGWMDLWFEAMSPYRFGDYFIWQPFTINNPDKMEKYLKLFESEKFKLKFKIIFF